MADDKKDDDGGKLLYCSFCGKSQHEVRKLIAGPSVFVCDECVDLCNDIIRDELIEENELGKIPAVCVYNKKGVQKGIGISDIGDIADAQRFIYNATSEIDQSIRLDSHPSLVKTPETNAGIGAGSIVHMPENLDPGLKPYILEFSGASVDKILQSINHTIENIDKMANTGAVRATESRSMSGVAMETEFQLLNAKLSEKADQLELAEENVWKLFCEYMGLSWTGEVDYPGSFNIRDTGSEIAQLKIAAETAPNDKQIQKAIAKQVAEWMDVDYDETVEAFMPHTMTNPETGETRVAMTEAEHLQLQSQGWIHEGE